MRSALIPAGLAPLSPSLRWRLRPSACLVAGVFSVCSPVWAGGSLSQLGMMNGGNSSNANSVSADGSVVVGDSTGGVSDGAYRWTSAGGMQGLGAMTDGDYARAIAVSSNGQTIVGWGNDLTHLTVAYRWTQAGGFQSIGTFAGGTDSMAWAVNGDGSVVVGQGGTAGGGPQHAFRWTQAGGMQDLGTLGGFGSAARGVSGDGNIVAGESDLAAGGGARAFRWTQAGGMQNLGTLGGNNSSAYAISTDGSTIVGESTNAASNFRAFRWTQAAGMQDLGTLGGLRSNAYGVNADGSVVVGEAQSADTVVRPFRWSQAGGMQSITDWLVSAGVAVAPAFANSMAGWANGVNADGSVVVGSFENADGNTEAFIARVTPDAPPPANNGGSNPVPNPGTGVNGAPGSGLILLSDVRKSLLGTAAGGSMALTSGNLLINGAHSRPLMRRVEADRNTFWLAGDWGTDDHGSRSGKVGLAEVGVGRNFGPLQANLSLGHTWSRQDGAHKGSSKVDGTYLMAEALLPVSGNLWATLGGYGHWGKADIKRGYFNAGYLDQSDASPDVNSWGLRARLDWDNAFQAAGADFTPYADVSYGKARMAAYTETGGGFPARFDARKEKTTELRLGVNATRTLASGITLLGMAEAVHRFQKEGARTSGELVGLFGFDLDGMKIRQDWLRVGAGVEGKVFDGIASLSANVTTQGAAPNAWLAANWRLAF